MLLYSRCPLGYKQCRIRLTLKLSLYCCKLVQKIFEIIFFLLYLMWFFFLVWFAFLCGCLKIMCSRAIHICAYECIQAFVSVCLWKNWLNYVNNKITTVGHHFIGFRWQTDHQSLRCFSPCLAGKATDGLKWCCKHLFWTHCCCQCCHQKQSPKDRVIDIVKHDAAQFG